MRTAVRLHFSTTDSYTTHRQRAPDISLSSKQTTLQRQISDEAHYCGSASLNNAMNQWADCQLHQKKQLFPTTHIGSEWFTLDARGELWDPQTAPMYLGAQETLAWTGEKTVSHTWLWCPLWAQLFQSLAVCVCVQWWNKPLALATLCLPNPNFWYLPCTLVWWKNTSATTLTRKHYNTKILISLNTSLIRVFSF